MIESTFMKLSNEVTGEDYLEESKEVVGTLPLKMKVLSSFREPDIVEGGIIRSVRGPKVGGL